MTSDGHRIGTVNVLDTKPHEPTDDDIATLSDLAAIVMDELELRLSALTTVSEERELGDTAKSIEPPSRTTPGLCSAHCCRRRCPTFPACRWRRITTPHPRHRSAATSMTCSRSTRSAGRSFSATSKATAPRRRR